MIFQPEMMRIQLRDTASTIYTNLEHGYQYRVIGSYDGENGDCWLAVLIETATTGIFTIEWVCDRDVFVTCYE